MMMELNEILDFCRLNLLYTVEELSVIENHNVSNLIQYKKVR